VDPEAHQILSCRASLQNPGLRAILLVQKSRLEKRN